MKVVCIENYYGEGLDEELFKYFKEADRPICYKEGIYTIKDNTVEYSQTPYHILIIEGIGKINIHLTKDLFDKYFIELAEWRQNQMDSIINGE
jgi:hypothetical protein